MKIAVTGATGFIGKYMVKALLNAGHEVRAFVRPGREEALDLPDGASVEIHVGDLRRPESVEGLLKDTDRLIHMAGLPEGTPMDEMRVVHIAGTEALLEEANRNTGKGFEFIVFSSALLGLTVYSEWRDSKRVMEKIPRGSSIDTAAFRPTQIYGVGDQRFTAPWLRKCSQRGGKLWIPHSGAALVNPVHIEDVVDAVIRYFGFERGIDCVYEIAGPKGITYNEFFDLTVQAAGGSVKRRNVSYKWMERYNLVKGIFNDGTQDRRDLINASISHEHNITNARDELGWEPRSYAEGIAQVAQGDWWKQEATQPA